jgi:membrane-associated phospholipid phosphatase
MSRRRKLVWAAKAPDALGQIGPRQAASVAGLATVVGLVRGRKKLGLPRPLSTVIAFAAAPGVAAGFERSVRRDGLVWGAQMWSYKNAFEIPHDAEEKHRQRVRVDYPIKLDSRLGGGIPPGQRLQRSLRRQGRLTALDKALSFFYWTWEAEPHLVMRWLRRNRPEAFPAAAGRLSATFDLTLLGYWAVPTAPPWWSSEKLGRMDGDVRRVMAEVAEWIKRKPNPTEGDHEMGANPFAAMPSDHFASAAMTAIILSEQGTVLGAAGWAYALVLAFALVYLGEHYVTDELAGLALALAVNQARRPLERAAEVVLDLGPRQRGPRKWLWAARGAITEVG